MSNTAYRAGLTIFFIILAISTLFCALVLINSDEDGILTFANIGTRFSEGDKEGTTGYDGQFVYFIARDGAGAEPLIDGPSLRYQRIFMPVLGRALALGSADLVPWVLVAIGILAHSIGAGLLTYVLVLMEVKPRTAMLAGIVYGLWVGELFAIRFMLTEPLCFALALAAVAAYLHERFRTAVLLLILATATKELGLIFAAGLAFHAFFNRRWKWAIPLAGAPGLFFLIWWGILRLWFGTLPTIYPAARTIRWLPFNGLFSVIPERGTVEFFLVALWVGLPTLILFLAALYVLWRDRKVSLAPALLLPAAGFVMIMPGVSWQDQIAVYRVAMPIVITGLMLVAVHFSRRLTWLAALWLLPVLLFLMLPQLWLK